MEIDLTDNESDVGNTQYYTKGSTYNYRNNYSTNYFEHHKDFFNTDGEAWVWTQTFSVWHLNYFCIPATMTQVIIMTYYSSSVRWFFSETLCCHFHIFNSICIKTHNFILNQFLFIFQIKAKFVGKVFFYYFIVCTSFQ